MTAEKQPRAITDLEIKYPVDGGISVTCTINDGQGDGTELRRMYSHVATTPEAVSETVRKLLGTLDALLKADNADSQQ